MSYRCLLALLLLATSATAQEWRTVDRAELATSLDASAAKFKAYPAFEFRSTIMAYTNSTDREPAERTSTVVWKMGDGAKAEHLGVISYQNSELNVTVDPEEQVIMVAEPVDFFAPLGTNYRDIVFEAAISIGKVTDATGVRYRARFAAGADFEIIEFAFDKEGWLRRVEAHWGRPVALIADNPLSAHVTPKVVLELGLPKRLAPGAVNVSPAQAVVVHNGTLQPAAAYQGYTLIDNRLHP
ncbi:MAG: hypothetical protein JNL52_03120 [Flavobacteriales bacterium]|nr:hypothetical protein [Flavobacteriales bacterium]